MLRVSADDNIVVTVEGMVVVGRRRRRRAGMHRPHPQGQSSPLWPQWAAAWPLVPRSRTFERPTLGSVRSFSTLWNANAKWYTQHPTRYI